MSSEASLSTRLSSPKSAAFFVVLFDFLGFGLIIPVQPFLAQSFGASTEAVTLLGAVFSLMQFLWAPFWGSLSDRYGRRPILLATITFTALGHIAFGFAQSLTILFLARALAGFGAANVAAAQAVISDVSEGGERSRSMALIGAAIGLGFVLGPGLGGILSQVSPQAPAFAAAAFAFLNLIHVGIHLPETRHPNVAVRSQGSILSFRLLNAPLQRLIGSTFLSVTAFAVMEQSIGLYIQSIWVDQSSPEALRRASGLNGVFMVVVGVAAIFMQGFAVRRLMTFCKERTLILVGLAVFVVSYIFIPVLGTVGSFPLFLSTAIILAIGSALFNPAMAGLISRKGGDSQHGLTLALNQSAAALGRIIGPTCAGVLFAVKPEIPFLVAALVNVVALGVVFSTIDWQRA